MIGAEDVRPDRFASSLAWESVATPEASRSCSEEGVGAKEPAAIDKTRAMIQGIIAGRIARDAGARMVVADQTHRQKPG